MGGVGSLSVVGLAPVMATVRTGAWFQLASEDDTTVSGEGNAPDVVAALRLRRRGLPAAGLVTLDMVAGGRRPGKPATA